MDADGNVYVTGSSPGLDTNKDYTTIKYSSGALALDTEKAKICWHHDDVHIEGKVYFPESIGQDRLALKGSTLITLAGTQIIQQDVEFEISGKNNDKWKYKDKDYTYGDIKEFKIDWKGAKFDYHGDLHMHTHFISGTDSTFCIHTKNRACGPR